MNQDQLHRFCVAPMMDWTDRHCRYFLRQLSRQTLLYTEMVTTGALLHGDRGRFLRFHEIEHPLALQLGGSNPEELATCTRLAWSEGYDEVNLNAGCPSDRVQNNRIGACLMAEPTVVRECLSAMCDAADIPVTLKTRIGIDDMDSDQALIDYIGAISESGISTVILHARIAILDGLSPKQNREIPPLNYARAALVKKHFPALAIVLNGGITNLDQCLEHLQTFDGVMLGREAYQNPWLLSDVDRLIYGAERCELTREDIILAMQEYIETALSEGTSLHHITRHMLGLYQGQRGGRKFRRHLSEHAWRNDASWQTLLDAMTCTSPQKEIKRDEICPAS